MNPRALSMVALLTACSASSMPSEGRSCTAIGCVDGFSVTVTSSGAWPAGEYVVKVVADGVTTTCSATLPLTQSSTSVCSGPGVQVGLSGSLLPASQQSISTVSLSSTPKAVAIEITRDGASIGARTYAPSYVTSRPNGPECEPICTNASDTLAVAP
ncbi:MAG: hypothetical protein IT374_10585 [Polyangiaceae bacterium]|nr:hypothetical protein [Polyangiaceae bacterium]